MQCESYYAYGEACGGCDEDVRGIPIGTGAGRASGRCAAVMLTAPERPYKRLLCHGSGAGIAGVSGMGERDGTGQGCGSGAGTGSLDGRAGHNCCGLGCGDFA
jgi:hypothetical protein